MTPETIPPALQELDQWVCWRTECRDCSHSLASKIKEYPECEGGATKKPLNPDSGRFASTTDPSTWTTFETAMACYRNDGYDTDGVGVVFADDGPLVGVDLDDCRDTETGEIDPWARGIIDSLESFTEISPSGTGIHVYMFGSVPSGGNRAGNVEMYDSARYFTVTGQHVDGTPQSVSEAPEAIREVHNEYVGSADEMAVSCSASRTTPNSRSSVDLEDVTPSDAGNNLADDDVIEIALNSDDPKFRQLWNGDTSDYPSHSEADLAFCNKLAFYTGCDPDQMDRLFRRSGLNRPKWNRTDYRERTIGKAILDCKDVYTKAVNGDTILESRSEVPADGGRLLVSDPAVSAVVETLQSVNNARTAEIAEHVGLSDRQVRRAINYLHEIGQVESLRRGRTMYYTLIEG